jgi:hypothetical protein
MALVFGMRENKLYAVSSVDFCALLNQLLCSDNLADVLTVSLRFS